MNLMKLKTGSFLAAALFVGALPIFAQKKGEGDTVNLRDGKQVQLTIDAENWDAIVGKGSPPISWDTVQSVEYANAGDFTKAVELFNAGNLPAAQKQFATLKKDSKLRKIFKQQVAFDSAFASEQEGKLDEAIAGYDDVIKSYDKGRFHVRAAERMAACMIAKKDVEGAMKAVEAIVAGVDAEPALSAALGLIRARLLLEQKKPVDAKRLFAAAALATGAPAWVVFEGQLGEATTILREGNAADAELRFRTLTKADASHHVLAGAWNGLGDVISERGRAKKDIDQLLDALYCYLRGCTVYAPLAGDPSDEYERSLAGSWLSFGYVADLETNKETKASYRARAEERKASLKKEFPFSSYLDRK